MFDIAAEFPNRCMTFRQDDTFADISKMSDIGLLVNSRLRGRSNGIGFSKVSPK